jgi:cytochrome c oxidase subunit III
MVLAVEAGHRMDKKGVILWLALTVVGGFFFVGSQAWEWYHYIHGSEHGAYVVNNDVRLSDGRVVGATTVVHVAKVEDGHLHFFKELEEAGESGGVKLPYRPAPGEDPVLVRGEDAHKLLAASTHIHGANLSRNEYGHPLYADFFFFVTGFHGFHVFSGVVINIIILIGVVLGTYHKRGHYEMVEKVGLYWHFVDLVWVFVFTFYYLL